jgi:hypothetical protein
MIRMKLEELTNIESLRVDIPERRLDVCHTNGYDSIFAALDSLGLDTKFISSEQVATLITNEVHWQERRVLFQVLSINFFFA